MSSSSSLPVRTPVLGLLVLVLVACGDRGDRPDRSDFQGVFDRAMEAVAAADLDALWPLLTEGGRGQIERELRSWQKALRDPARRPVILRLVRERRGEVSEEEVELAGRGTIRDAWRFFLRSDPREARPRKAGFEVAADGRSATILYLDPRGVQRAVRLVQRPSGWYVDELQL
ncbi:MAG: hypothetical protein ACC662_09995 [Planctomycetota bacterium]